MEELTWRLTQVEIPDDQERFQPSAEMTGHSLEWAAIEDEIGLASGTIPCLVEAFSKGIGRDHFWDLTNIQSSQYLTAWQTAASIYKRGVLTTPPAVSPAEHSGSYRFVFRTVPDLVCEKPSAWFVVDEKVASHWPILEGVGPHLVPISESLKNLATVATICRAWKDRGRPSHWVIVAGGCLSDLAGFAAALLGCSFEFVPTTLLAMVDACVGGKTGVNFPPFGKNQVGRFAFPSRVTLCREFLTTLPTREFRSGLAEALKHGFISGDKNLWEGVPLSADSSLLSDEFMTKVIAIKAAVVAEDADERGRRAILNFGHTLGHGLEALSMEEGRMTHGEAVAIGMAFAAGLSHQYAGLPRKDKDTVWHAIFSAGVLSYVPTWFWDGKIHLDSLRRLMGHDKKATASKVNWILLRALGEPYRQDDGRFGYALDLETALRGYEGFFEELKERWLTWREDNNP